MKLVLFLEDGTAMKVEGVVSFKEIETHALGYEVAQTPTQGKLFKVNPLGIDRSLFKEWRNDVQEENARTIIQKAFEEVNQQYEKYGKPFYTLIPKVNWAGSRSGENIYYDAIRKGGKMADWVEQALEWAQRICNGESWQTVCCNPDTARWHRLILGVGLEVRRVGGSTENYVNSPATRVFPGYSIKDVFCYTVPLITFREK